MKRFKLKPDFEKKFCVYCGKPNRPMAKFCKECQRPFPNK